MKRFLMSIILIVIGILSFSIGISYAQLQSKQAESEQSMIRILKTRGVEETDILEVRAAFSLMHREEIEVRLREEPSVTYRFAKPDQTIRYLGADGVSFNENGKHDARFRTDEVEVTQK